MAKSARKTTDLAIVHDITRRAGANRPADLNDSDIARRAFELYCARGWQHGHDLDDWLQAERELRASSGARL